ncbi:hypothetical protein NP493_241g06042 [Ridgeia piscesae]|uniref:Cerebellar degeneration-related protein 2-like n=1 Tax=Ridgeia piscesae TaxID=27915 RepID=A0AAD9NZD3_RIDPI|nr:hypothetical protein NP493_241g06042 [Ridgeia piscesae]
MSTQDEYTLYPDQEYSEENDEVWYENDLQLAAQLGKSLLDRNRQLEAELRLSQQTQVDQAKEIQLLVKQLDVLRNVNESRMRIYEEVDRHSQIQEKKNEELLQDVKTCTQRIHELTDEVSSLEERYEEAQLTIDELKSERNVRQKRPQRTWSVPSLPEKGCDDTDGLTSYARFDQQIIEKDEQRRRNDHIRQLKLQLHTEKTRRCNLEKELDILVQENQSLAGDREVYEAQSQRVLQLERDLETAQLNSEQLCKKCGRQTADVTGGDSGELLEHDLNDLKDIPHGELLRLKNGGSAYGSRESLNLIGLETEDGIGEVCSFLIDAKQSPDSPSALSNDDGGKNIDSVSILGELEEQYRKLVKKYEAVIEVKNKTRESRDVDTETNPEPTTSGEKPRELEVTPTTQTSCWHLDLRSPVDPTDHHFENGPPEYKRLFKEIFDTLRRSVVYEDGKVTHNGRPDTGDSSNGDSAATQK